MFNGNNLLHELLLATRQKTNFFFFLNIIFFYFSYNNNNLQYSETQIYININTNCFTKIKYN